MASARRPSPLPRVEAPAAAALALAAVVAALGQALVFPAFALPLAALILASVVAVALRPGWVLAILPAAMPVLDLAPASGRLLWDEFDLLQLALLALAWWRTRGRRSAAPVPRAAALAFALLAVSLGVSLVCGLWPLAWPDANSLFSAHDRYNALRIGKGALWALALAALMPRLPGDDAARLRLIGSGLCVGLAATVAVVLWERAAFAGLLDFESDYRVTGPFSAMHTGGATIECFLAVGTAAALAAFVQSRGWRIRTALALLLALASYAMMVTYSRNGYAALLAAVAVMALAMARRGSAQAARRLAVAAVVLAMLGAAMPVLLGGYAQQRLARMAEDYGVRLAHWRDALALRDRDGLTAVAGAGLGRFPAAHHARSAEPVHAGVFRIDSDASGSFLRLGPGAKVYVEQFVDAGRGRRLELAASVRAAAGARLGVALCEKWLFASAQCARIAPGTAQTEGDWVRLHWLLDTGEWNAAPPGLRRPVKLALFHASGDGDVDVARLQLAAEDDRSMLVNGDFGHGLDGWFYTTDVDPPWHIHSLPVTVLFDQGWLGVLAWGAMLLLALEAAARRTWGGDLGAAGLLAALAAFCVSGLVNSLIDEPRMLWLWCLLLWLAAATPPRAK